MPVPIPSKHSPWELLQAILMRIHNKEVREYFRDAPDNDLETTRSTLKHVCIIQDFDTATITLIRMFTFWVVCGRLHALIPEVYGLPVASFQEAYAFYPQVKLHFQQRYPPTGSAPLTGQISFRLMDLTSEQVTQTKVNQLARDIQIEFGGSTPYKWQKGRVLIAYTDRKKGYALKILCRSRSEGEEVIRKVLSINGDTAVWANAKISEAITPNDKYPLTPERQTILGKSYREPERRRTEYVEVQYAELHLWPKPQPIILYDRTLTKVGAVIYEGATASSDP